MIGSPCLSELQLAKVGTFLRVTYTEFLTHANTKNTPLPTMVTSVHLYKI